MCSCQSTLVYLLIDIYRLKNGSNDSYRFLKQCRDKDVIEKAVNIKEILMGFTNDLKWGRYGFFIGLSCMPISNLLF